MENSDSQEVVAQGTEPPAEAPSKNPSIPEPVPSASVESTTGASGGSNFDIQLLLRVMEENRQKDKKEQEERDEKNRQKDKKEQEEKDRLN
jgi:hypothetical protein